MNRRCKKVFMVKGFGQKNNQAKKNDRSYSPGPGSYVKNLGCGNELFSVRDELFVSVEIGREIVSISIDKQFRDKFQKPGAAYANFSKKRLGKIALSMPLEVDVEETGDPLHPYRVTDKNINTWYFEIVKNS